MNKYELVYDLKEHLDAYSQTYDDYIMSYGEADMIYHYIEEKGKEIERLNNIINELEEYICTIEYDERNYNETWQIAVRIHNKLKELKGE